MPRSPYDPYGRGRSQRSSLNPRGEPARTLTADQLRQIEAQFQEMERRAAQWEARARELEAALARAQTQAAEWEARARELQAMLAQADRSSQRPGDADRMQRQLRDLQTQVEHLESAAAEAEQRASAAEKALESTTEKMAELEERTLRAQADFQNTQKRLERRYADRADEAIMAFARDLLPALDNLDRAIEHASPAAATNESLQQGVELTRSAFLTALARHSIFPIEAEGKPFDPEVHEAVGIVPDPNLPPGTVVAVEQKGYTFGDKLLRPARVLITPID